MKTLQLILFVCFTVGFPSLNMIKAQNIKTFVTSDGETLYYTSTGKGQRVFMLPRDPEPVLMSSNHGLISFQNILNVSY